MPLPPDPGAVVLPLARAAISRVLGIPAQSDESASWLREPGACFVTLRCEEALRGCIGTLEPSRLLLEDIKLNAIAAALHDDRFPPLTAKEWPMTRVEVSILSALEAIRFHDEVGALAQLRPGVDGVVFEVGRRRSTFLPQVWENLPEAREFMAHLKRKAGVDSDFWADDVKLSRYTVRKFIEQHSEATQ
jgi:AmmeMemoRadiSam system protein A